MNKQLSHFIKTDKYSNNEKQDVTSFANDLTEWTPHNKHQLKSVNNLKDETYRDYQNKKITKKQLDAVFDRIEQERIK